MLCASRAIHTTMKTRKQYVEEQNFDHVQRALDIDLGLAVLSVIREPNVPLTYAAMAADCNCSRSAICEIERRALRKLANRLRFGNDTTLRELVEQIIHRNF